MRDYTIEDLKRIVRPELGDNIPLLLYRILRIIGMRSMPKKHEKTLDQKESQ